MRYMKNNVSLELKHAPTLKTVIMVEDVLKEIGFVKNRTALLRKLPKKVQFGTLTTILQYLEESGKIYVGLEGIVWGENNSPKFREFVKRSRRLL
jgi:hypothetical protein